jgi:hypothetical protein
MEEGGARVEGGVRKDEWERVEGRGRIRERRNRFRKLKMIRMVKENTEDYICKVKKNSNNKT